MRFLRFIKLQYHGWIYKKLDLKIFTAIEISITPKNLRIKPKPALPNILSKKVVDFKTAYTKTKFNKMAIKIF